MIRERLARRSERPNGCRAKRSVESYPTFAASVQCSNPRMIQAFNAAHYRYMDLIETLATKRLEVAERIDRNELTEDQAKLENAKLYMEMSRDSAAR